MFYRSQKSKAQPQVPAKSALDELKDTWRLHPLAPRQETFPSDVTSDIYQTGRSRFPRRRRGRGA